MRSSYVTRKQRLSNVTLLLPTGQPFLTHDVVWQDMSYSSPRSDHDDINKRENLKRHSKPKRKQLHIPKVLRKPPTLYTSPFILCIMDEIKIQGGF